MIIAMLSCFCATCTLKIFSKIFYFLIIYVICLLFIITEQRIYYKDIFARLPLIFVILILLMSELQADLRSFSLTYCQVHSVTDPSGQYISHTAEGEKYSCSILARDREIERYERGKREGGWI